METGSSSRARGGGAARRQLLVLDLNGFLVDRVRLTGGGGAAPAPSAECDLREGGCAIYYRAHMREFIGWCLETFEVGVWTSAKRQNVRTLLDEVFGARKSQLRFVWDQSDCTTVGALRHPDCSFKPIFLKELSRLWTASCAAGAFDPTNTILLDDTVYKTAANPAHTSIHPREWKAARVGEPAPARGDGGLAPSGELRRLLSLVARAADVREALAHAAPSFPSLLPSSHERLRLIRSIPGLLEYVDALQPRAPKLKKKKRLRATDGGAPAGGAAPAAAVRPSEAVAAGAPKKKRALALAGGAAPAAAVRPGEAAAAGARKKKRALALTGGAAPAAAVRPGEAVAAGAPKKKRALAPAQPPRPPAPQAAPQRRQAAEPSSQQRRKLLVPATRDLPTHRDRAAAAKAQR